MTGTDARSQTGAQQPDGDPIDGAQMSIGVRRLDGYSLLGAVNEDLPHFTWRSVAAGLLIGTLLCFSNMYFGLQTGWISMMSLQSSLLGYAIFKPFQGKLRVAFGPIENVFLQTIAVATGTMPLAAGFVGIIPALASLEETDRMGGPIRLSATQLIIWSLGLAFFGIIREKLRFPSGTATAQMISILHQKSDPTSKPTGATLMRRNARASRGAPSIQPQPRPAISLPPPPSLQPAIDEDIDHEKSWQIKWRALLYSFTLSSVYTLLTYFGLPTTLSMLLGSIVGWGFLSPLAYYMGWAPGKVNDWKTGSRGWIMWISLAVMVAESVVSLGVVLVRLMIKVREGHENEIRHKVSNEYQGRRRVERAAVGGNANGEGSPERRQLLARRMSVGDLAEEEIEEEREEEEEQFFEIPLRRQRAYEEDEAAPPEQLVKPIVTITGLIISSLLCIAGVTVLFGQEALPVYATIIAVLVAMLLSVLGVGEKFLIVGIGKVSQVLFAQIVPGGIVANLVAGGIAEAGAYVLYSTVYIIPGKEFPAPTAEVWLDMSRLVNGQPLPKYTLQFGIFFAALFSFLVLVKEIWNVSWARYIPQGIAFAVGIYNPPNFTLARVIGGYIGWRWDRYCDTTVLNGGDVDGEQGYAQRKTWSTWITKYLSWIAEYRMAGRVVIIVVASGFVLGEGTFAIFAKFAEGCDL
ncbi:OPT oligopeptide transporter protein-domain-containing protein [Jimgerdemannia flammicorona]|uniref:OPT oligopeptide transporter protein-domain-containing protein n=1 Tax=Jimgerdemannia flammicorona TaxID=994334 RepID=A0A433Q6Q2_9FUNG|nr:OPT oligopeptide transporter protein-domain-containing protein [Jimgerdemannia flammicorona]